MPLRRSSASASLPALQARLRGLGDAARKVADEARRVAEAEQDRAVESHRAARAAAANAGGPALRDAVTKAVQRAATDVAPAIGRLVGSLAPGLAGEPPASATWQTPDAIGTETSLCVRIGALAGMAAGTPAELPVVAPLLGTTGWAVTADPPERAQSLLQSVVLRQIASSEPFRVRVDAFDPRLTGAMGLLGQLSVRYPQLVPKAIHAPAGLQQMLSALTEVSSARAARLSQLGQRRFTDLVNETGRVTDPYRLVLLFDYPAGIDLYAQRDLLRLAASGGDRGITFLVHHNPSVQAERDVDPAELLRALSAVSVTGDRAALAVLPDVPVRLDPPFDADTASAVCESVARLAERAVLPTVDFTGTLPARSDWWGPVDDEVSTVLGFDDRTPVLLRLRTSNPALPHVLVGGAVGQGKSNLLLVLIHGLAARYAPDDLEMYLLDFKHGVEFSALGPAVDREHWLPHIRVLGVHSDRAFGLAVLRHLSDELARRSELFKPRGLADISDFPPGPDRPPRMLVVLDEFQVLLEDDDELADEAARLLERLARLGRAYGVHLVLATQTIEGVARLASRRDSIFGQVPYRIALKTTPSDSQAILRTGNTSAADLRFRGEAIVNQNFGSPDDNQRVLVSFADKSRLSTLRRELFDKTDGPRPPRVFHLGEPARLTELVPSGPDLGADPVRAWAGLPIAVTEHPVTIEVRPEPGAGVLVLGDGPADALGVLTGLAVSVAAAGTRFVVLDAINGSTTEPKAALVETLTRLGAEVEIVAEAEAIHQRLFDLRDEIATNGTRPTYLLGLGLHAVPRMKQHSDGRMEAPAGALTTILRDGPASGVVTFGWWNRLHVCTEQLGYQRANVAAHIFLRHPLDGVRSVCGPLVRWTSEPYRALVWDGLTPEAIPVVPFAPLKPAEVTTVLERIGR